MQTVGLDLPIAGEYNLLIRAVKPDRRKRDIGNLEKALSDILVAGAIVIDDSFCRQIIAEWADFGDPCVVVVTSV